MKKKKREFVSLADLGEKNPTHQNEAGDFWLIDKKEGFLLFYAKLKDGHCAFAICHPEHGWLYETPKMEEAGVHLDMLAYAKKINKRRKK